MARKYKRDSRGRFAGGGGRVSGSRGSGPKGGVQRGQQSKKPPTPAQQAAAKRRLIQQKRVRNIRRVATAIQVGVVAGPLIAATGSSAITGTASFTRGFKQGYARANFAKQAARAASQPYRTPSTRVVLSAIGA